MAFARLHALKKGRQGKIVHVRLLSTYDAEKRSWRLYRTIDLGAGEVKHLKKDTNVLAAYANVEYDEKTQEPRGQMELFIEGLKMADLK